MSRRFAPLMCLLLAGCAYHAPNIVTPDIFQAEGMAAQPDGPNLPAVDWWTRFGSEELNALIAEAKTSGYDLKIAASRILQSEASFKISQSTLLPTVSGSGSGTRSYSDDANGDFSGSTRFDTSLRASYTLDLFDAHNNISASKLRFDSARFTRESTEIALVSSVITQYLALLSARERLASAETRIRNVEEVMRLLETQRRVGTISDLEIVQQRNTLAGQRGQIPALRTAETSALNALAVLLGRAPEGFDVKGKSLDELTLPEVTAGIPSTLLRRRPDLRASEANLHAQHYDVNSAILARFPSISLNASGTSSSSASSIDLLSLLSPGTLAASLGASIAAPLFSGGRLTAQQRSAEAAYQLQLDTYQQNVLVALRDVENALTSMENTSIQFGFTQESAVLSEESYRLAQLRYRAGIVDFQTVLNAQNSFLSGQESLVSGKQSRYNAVVTLVQALGGGWDGELQPIEHRTAEK